MPPHRSATRCSRQGRRRRNPGLAPPTGNTRPSATSRRSTRRSTRASTRRAPSRTRCTSRLEGRPLPRTNRCRLGASEPPTGGLRKRRPRAARRLGLDPTSSDEAARARPGSPSLTRTLSRFHLLSRTRPLSHTPSLAFSFILPVFPLPLTLPAPRSLTSVSLTLFRTFSLFNWHTLSLLPLLCCDKTVYSNSQPLLPLIIASSVLNASALSARCPSRALELLDLSHRRAKFVCGSQYKTYGHCHIPSPSASFVACARVLPRIAHVRIAWRQRLRLDLHAARPHSGFGS
mmetsp:Transcript_11627/g.24954  ORF Transcript_11627/g.24954 Transcript_11627/m.24954 type:complete len:289 (-) Transcript_11627:182-1048(-)